MTILGETRKNLQSLLHMKLCLDEDKTGKEEKESLRTHISSPIQHPKPPAIFLQRTINIAFIQLEQMV